MQSRIPEVFIRVSGMHERFAPLDDRRTRLTQTIVEGPAGMKTSGSGTVLVWFGAGTMVGAGILRSLTSELFRPYFGSLDPVLVVAAALGLGFVALSFIRAGDRFLLRRRADGRQGLRAATAIAVGFTGPVILVDVLGGFPEAMNVELPQALLFYPVMAVVAEVAFHLVPLALVLGLLGRHLERDGSTRTVWLAVVVVSLIEPGFHVVQGGGESPAWANAYVGIHVFAFSIVGLHLFRCFGFATMYSFRLVYYLTWHILWGWARVPLLF